MKSQIASEPRRLKQGIKAAAVGVFGEAASLVRRGISLGVVLFLALTTLSALNHSANFLKNSGKASVGKVVKHENGITAAQGTRNLWVPRVASVRPVYVARQENRSVSRNAQDTLRESGYLIGELGTFSGTLARFGK